MDADTPLAPSDGQGTPEVGRAALLQRVAITLGGIAAGGAAAAGLADADHTGHGSASLSHRDREVLGLAWRLEQLQTAFYAEAIRRGKLTGEPAQYARTVGHEEREHLRHVEHELGNPNHPPIKFHFGNATANDAQFVAAAAKIEDIVLAAYNGQAENMSRATLTSLARLISVEARHAAWARSLAGELPAPTAVDVPISATKALDAIKPYLA